MTDLQTRPAPPAIERLKTDADVAAAFAEATHPDTIARRAVPLLCAVLGVRPGHPEAFRLLQGHLTALGDPKAAERAAEFAVKAETDHPALRRAVAALDAGQPAMAATALNPFLAERPDDPVALRLLALCAKAGGQSGEAAALLARALEAAPDYVDARRARIDALVVASRHEEALAEVDRLIASETDTFDLRAVRASILKRLRRSDEALAAYESLFAERPDDAELLIDRGNARRDAGDAQGAVADYRTAIAIQPTSGRAWLSLADMKTAPLNDADIGVIEDALRADQIGPEPRSALHFAAGRALETAKRYPEAFSHYASGNALHRLVEPYDARAIEGHVRRTVALVEAAANPPAIQPPRDGGTPIFVVGLPRSGSTLIERILSAHPEIEATEELPYLRAIANELARGGDYPRVIATLRPDVLDALRARYLEQAAAHRREGATFFVDKAPANWQHIPLIAALFPDARIVDARRNPLDCGFSNYAQRFGRGHDFAYSLAAIGHHTRQYRAAMAAIDKAWPGRVHRVEHEDLIDTTESEIRRLLAYIGVAYDPRCLAFHEQADHAFSASSEQVRRPLNREGVGRATPFKQWLGPLEQMLGAE